MGSISTTEAALLSTSQVQGRFLYDCRPTDQLFQVLPFVPIEGDKVQLAMIDAATTGLAGYASAVTAGGALNVSMPSITSRQFALARIPAELEINGVVVGDYGTREDIVQACLNVKVDALRDVFKTMLIEGTGASGQFTGLRSLCNTYSQQFGADNTAANGGTVQKGELEKLLGYLHPRSSSNNTFLVMHPNAVTHLARNYYQSTQRGRVEGIGDVPLLAGVPILEDGFIPISETQGASTDCTSIYAVMLGKDVGLAGIYPATAQGREIQVRGPIAKDGFDSLWYHISWDTAIVVYNKCSIARMYGVKWSN